MHARGLSTFGLVLALAFALGLANPGPGPGPCGAEPVAHAPGADGRWATTDDGIRIWYEVEGESTGVPIVLIAGGPGSPHNGFHVTHRRLAGLGRLVHIDNRGRGRSQPGRVARPYTIENDVADVEAVRRALGAETIVVYGRSYGGMVAQAYALAHPTHVRGLILSNTIDGATAWRNENIAATHEFLKKQFPERWERIEKLHDQGILTSEDTLSILFGPLSELYNFNLENDSTFRVRMSDVREAGIPGHANEVYLAMIGRDPEWSVDGTLSAVELLPGLRSVTVPALVLAGRYDRICPPVASRRIAGALPHGRLVIFERSGHRPELEEADRWFAVVSEFLTQTLALEPPDASGGAR